jgi:hypothetical protein
MGMAWAHQDEEMMTIYFWIGVTIGVLGTLADYYYTRKGLKAGVGREKNQITAWFMEKLGFSIGLIVKAIVVDLLVLWGGVVLWLYGDLVVAAGTWAGAIGSTQLYAAYGWYKRLS